MLAVCPRCQRTTTIPDPGWQDCKFCGVRSWFADPQDPDRPVEDDRLAVAPAVEDRPTVTPPWETDAAGGVVGRFLTTLGRILFQHRTFFAALPDGPFDRRVVLFGVLAAAIGLVLYFQFQAVSLAMLERVAELERAAGRPAPWVDELLAHMAEMKVSQGFFLFSAALSPLIAWGVIWLTGRMLLAAWLIGRRSLPPPLGRLGRMAAYLSGAWILLPVPVVGPVWMLVTLYSALRHGLEVSSRLGLLGVLLYFLFWNAAYNAWVGLHAALFP